MPTFKCPSCREQVIPFKDKYRAGWWSVLHCPHCGSRLAAFPWLLLLITMLYLWDVVWFVGIYHFTGNLMPHLVILIGGWLLLDLINLYLVPLVRLRPRM